MASAGRHLFVYGLLMGSSMNGHAAEERARLKREATLLGPASIRGQLFDLGSFPGLVDSDDSEDLVHGEVYLLNVRRRPSSGSMISRTTSRTIVPTASMCARCGP